MQIFNPTKDKFEKLPEYMSIYLIFYDDTVPHMYYCNACRNPIMQYRGEVIMEIPGLHDNNYPIIIQCKNDRCKRRYNFLGFTGK